ncbi:MAG: rod shape-determining protein MreC [Planctomycetes bacterium]|nr:rod shape-determining protein MreC [Planctomycetota bacterium]
MKKQQEKLSLAWLLQHPLVATCILLALTMVLPFLRIGERIKSLTFLPLAYANDGVGEPDINTFSLDERRDYDLQKAIETVANLTTENARLRTAFKNASDQSSTDFASNKLPEAVWAKVIFHGDSSGWRNSCIINRGTEKGIEVGMPVVAGRTLIGRIHLVAEKLAIVQLISDPGFAASCVVVTGGTDEVPTDYIRGVIRGNGSAMPHFPKLELEDVAIAGGVKAGSLVLTNDFSGQFPAGLYVGVVREVIPQAGYLQVRIEAGLELTGMEIVQVLKHKRPTLEQEAKKLLRKK